MFCNMCNDAEMKHQFVLSKKDEEMVSVPQSKQMIDAVSKAVSIGSPTFEGKRITHIFNCTDCPNSQVEYYQQEDAIAYMKAMHPATAQFI